MAADRPPIPPFGPILRRGEDNHSWIIYTFHVSVTSCARRQIQLDLSNRRIDRHYRVGMGEGSSVLTASEFDWGRRLLHTPAVLVAAKKERKNSYLSLVSPAPSRTMRGERR